MCSFVLRGAIGLLLLAGSGAVTGNDRLDATGPLRGVELAAGCPYTLVVLHPAMVIVDRRQGADRSREDKDVMPGFPLEGTADARQQALAWRRLFDSVAV